MYVLQFACMHCRLSLKYVIVLRRQMTEENNHILRYFVISKSNQFRMAWRFKEMHYINESTYNFCK